MIDLFNAGGPLFMGILSIIATVMIALSVFNARTVLLSKAVGNAYDKVNQIREVGLLALIVGVLATTINLMGAFSAIEQAADVSMALLAGGLKYATFTLVYGMIIYILSILTSLVLKWRIGQLPD